MTGPLTCPLAPDKVSRQGVYLYAAPSDSAYSGNVTARVLHIVDDSTCRLGGGGDFVTVGIYFNGTLYGRATYAHLDRSPNLHSGLLVTVVLSTR